MEDLAGRRATRVAGASPDPDTAVQNLRATEQLRRAPRTTRATHRFAHPASTRAFTAFPRADRAPEAGTEVGERLLVERLQPVVTAFRWSVVVVGIGLAIAQDRGFSHGVLIGALFLVANSVCFTLLPVSFEATGARADAMLLGDLGATLTAVVLTGGWDSPFFLSLTVPVLVAGLSRGYRESALIAGLAIAAVAIVEVAQTSASAAFDAGAQPALILLLTGVIGSYGRGLFLEVQQQHERVLDETTRLVTANRLLLALHDVAQSLPGSLDLGEVVASARGRFRDLFDYTSAAIVVYDETTGAWRVELADGVRLPAWFNQSGLPELLRRVESAGQPLVVRDLLEDATAGCAPLARSALAVALRARGNLVGFVAIEHTTPGRFSTRDSILLAGLADPLALAIDNALWFSRIRALAAEAERARIARDLHDRLAQSLAYVGFELERLGSAQHPAPNELTALRDLVRALVLELRETLFQLRLNVTETADLEEVAADYAQRFQSRTGITVTFTSRARGERLPLPVEQEVWRILQESLTNVERHAQATHAWVTWAISGGRAWLEIRDDGVGFRSDDVRREAFGLTGMRERADAIGAHLTLDTEPGCGTRVLVELEIPA